MVSRSTQVVLARVLLGLAVLALPVLAGCDREPAKTALGYTADAKRAYEAALEEFSAHNWVESQTAFREVKRKYGYSKYARLAELRIADADFEQEKYAEAVRGYRQFVHDHRSDADEVSYARSRIAEAQYREVGDSFLLPTGEERDQANVSDSFKELRSFLHDYPQAAESPHMRELLADITARLVRHELYVARFYLRRDNYDAAVGRILYALRTYADPAGKDLGTRNVGGLEPEALVLLGETYLRMHRWTDARAAFDTLLQRYPTSALVLHAEAYLAYMKDRGV